MPNFYDRGRNRTLVPREIRENNAPGVVLEYKLSPAELENYRTLPVPKGKKPMTLGRGRKKNEQKLNA
ncbi:hypothetical protein PP175_21465 [Aneurinibacillus sp. Ricciae_BoGa-3]|uniref:hypothetical protein n=1 Tax=Aneurinibacillus sp. Ricciae_BoGa-3 TaxID=3022697 RepID=UPI00234195AD|nr:hypothetical protein [Aneurinibacillus sp. Ricciae_BoGa-3]WCK53861.1 hypothetical protein PP175_21465 [Aneurinibacillus sp. Ricciae_BoGa-3]